MKVRGRMSADRPRAWPIGAAPGRAGHEAMTRVHANQRNDGMPPSGTLISTSDPPPTAAPMHVLNGIAVSPGIAVGPILVLDPRGMRLPPRTISAAAVEREVERLDRGLEVAGHKAEEAEDQARARLGPQYADILAAHARMIGDVTLRADARARVEHEQISAEHAVIEVLEEHATRLERLSDSYLAARAADVRDIEERILSQLIGQRPKSFQDDLPTPALVLAQDLSPSETAGLDRDRVLGFATEAGGRASHTAIVAAALEIPAVVGLGKFLDIARSCRTAVIDGDEGLVILDPDLPTQARYRAAAAERSARFEVLYDKPICRPKLSIPPGSNSGAILSSPRRSAPVEPGRRGCRVVPHRVSVPERPAPPQRRGAVRGLCRRDPRSGDGRS